MNGTTFRLVLLVSCAHALVHIYMLSFGAVELLVADEFEVGKATTGLMASCLRLPFGCCALVAGWLADHFGAKRLLVIYLAGCSAAVLLAFATPSLAVMFAAMFTLGVFASIYHPAGVGLISHQTTPANRPMALGYHGIFGSAGIAAGPLAAGLLLAAGVGWRNYYLMLCVPGVLLGVLFLLRLSTPAGNAHAESDKPAEAHAAEEDRADWFAYFALISLVSLAGVVYASMVTFLPRYLAGAGLDPARWSPRLFGALGFSSGQGPNIGVANLLTSLVLVLGIFGQYAGGRLARPGNLEWLLAGSLLAAAPCVGWMGFAQGWARLAAAALFAPLFFMHQPVFNSLVAKYTPRRRRSLCYGLSFTMGFGVGSTGPTISGMIAEEWLNYAVLAGLLVIAGTAAAGLGWRDGRDRARAALEPLEEQDALI